jgi:hypothetical protein
MCEAGKALKLCICNNKIDKSKPYWTLARKTIKQNVPELALVGLYMPPDSYFDEGFNQTNQWLAAQLNNANCFDFNYAPLEDDKLVMHLAKHKFEFVYSQNPSQWQMHDSENPFLPSIKRSVQAKGCVSK